MGMLREKHEPDKGIAPTLDLLSAALEYRARGMSIIPVNGKKAAGLWKPFQTVPADEKTLRRLFAREGVTGLAVILGAVSGGLACRDWDEASAYHRWADSYPDLAAILPTVQTSRGFHVYFAGPDQFQNLGDGEYRGDSAHYCLLPPSRHPDGPLYRWIVPLPNGALPVVDPAHAGLRTDAHAQYPGTHSPSSPATQQHTQHSMCPRFSIQIENSIKNTLPTGPAQRNRKLFELACQLKAFMPDAGKEELREIVRGWHARALPFIRTKEWFESWEDFVSAWLNIKGGWWTEIVQTAEAMPMPFGFASAAGRLVNLCAALQQHHGPVKSWPLSCRRAADTVGIGHDKAAKLLKLLIFEGVIQLVTPAGPKGSRRAAEYRFLGDES